MTKQEKATLSMPTDLKLKARAKAIAEGKNLSLVVRELLLAWLQDDADHSNIIEAGAEQ